MIGVVSITHQLLNMCFTWLLVSITHQLLNMCFTCFTRGWGLAQAPTYSV